MVLYSKFGYGSQFSGEIRYMVYKLQKFLGYTRIQAFFQTPLKVELFYCIHGFRNKERFNANLMPKLPSFCNHFVAPDSSCFVQNFGLKLAVPRK